MDKEHAVDAAVRFSRALAGQGLTINKIILYGSYAQGTQHEGSDIDLVVISEGFAGKSYWERIDILTKAIYEVWEPIEAVAYTPEEWQAGNTTIYEYARNGNLINTGAL